MPRMLCAATGGCTSDVLGGGVNMQALLLTWWAGSRLASTRRSVSDESAAHHRHSTSCRFVKRAPSTVATQGTRLHARKS